jgi:hypothetical protein
MKKILVAIIAVCFMCGNAWSAPAGPTIDLTGACEWLNANHRVQKCLYTSTTSVLTGETQVFDIKIPSVYGNITSFGIQSLSTDLDWWVSESEDATATEVETIIYVTGTNLGMSAIEGGMFGTPIYFRNKDTTETNHLYLTVDNDGAEDMATVFFYLIFGDNVN